MSCSCAGSDLFIVWRATVECYTHFRNSCSINATAIGIFSFVYQVEVEHLCATMGLHRLVYMHIYRYKAARITDKRVKVMNDVITGIRVIKMYGWEYAFSKLVSKIRR